MATVRQRRRISDSEKTTPLDYDGRQVVLTDSFTANGTCVKRAGEDLRGNPATAGRRKAGSFF